ncbi:MAG TPA: o-succinylbenzoate--CoA ligase [Actinomycetales bacterium]|nr:o-succinylbenzoate--CoA ligase [Actinomycetales bacterium]
MPRQLTPVVLAQLEVLEALDRLAAAIEGAGDALLPVAPDNPRGAAALDPRTPLREGEDDESDPTALVVATSGSTGEPKGALLPASALRASATATHDRLGGPGTWLLALAPHHVAGVQVLLRSLAAGTRPEVLPLDGGFDVDAFSAAARALERRATSRRYTALVPTQLVRLLEAGGEPTRALAAFDGVLLGGAAVAPAVLRRATEAGVRVVTTYGMSETCGGCVYDGVPLDGVTVQLDDGRPRIRIGGPVVARGYRLRPGAEPFDTRDGTRWFTTNDLGSLDHGRLTVVGRADDVIITGGENVAPQQVEAVVSELPGVRECLVVGVPDVRWGQRVVVLVVPNGSASVARDGVRTAVKSALGSASAPQDLLLVEAIPATTVGKPDRRAATALAARMIS